MQKEPTSRILIQTFQQLPVQACMWFISLPSQEVERCDGQISWKDWAFWLLLAFCSSLAPGLTAADSLDALWVNTFYFLTSLHNLDCSSTMGLIIVGLHLHLRSGRASEHPSRLHVIEFPPCCSQFSLCKGSQLSAAGENENDY